MMFRSSSKIKLPRAAVESLERRSLLSAPYSLLADINTGSPSSLPEQFQTVNGKVLFLAYSTTGGQMLWSTDGTSAGTKIVTDLNPNPQSGEYEGYGQASIVIGNEMYFAGTDYAHGTELWKTDGTTAGTQLVGDLNPGLDSSTFSGFTNFNGKLAFEANNQLWISDGTPGGTISLGNLNPTGVGGTSDRMAVMGSELYFFRYATPNGTGPNTGELWETDGTAAGTREVIDIGSGDSSNVNATASDIISIGSTLYFAADDGTHGWELYRSDGTAAGTSMVDDLAPAPATGLPSDGSYPTDLTNVDGTLYFTASANYGPPLLYRLDGTGQPQVVSTIALSPQNLVADGDVIYFTAADGTHGRELWQSDGTTAGTRMVADINPGTADSDVADITAVGANIFFSANDGSDGPELWISDGTAAGTALYDSSSQATLGSSPGDFTALHGQLIFEADVLATGEEPYSIALPSAAATPPLTATPVTTTPITATPITTTPIAIAQGPSVTVASLSKQEIDLKFSADVSASFGRASFNLMDMATGLRIDPATLRVTYNHKTNVARITFRNHNGNVLMTGHYRLRINAGSVTSASGKLLASDASFGITISNRKT